MENILRSRSVSDFSVDVRVTGAFADIFALDSV